MTAPSHQSMGNLIDILKANHEEADTRLVVHTAEAISQIISLQLFAKILMSSFCYYIIFDMRDQIPG